MCFHDYSFTWETNNRVLSMTVSYMSSRRCGVLGMMPWKWKWLRVKETKVLCCWPCFHNPLPDRCRWCCGQSRCGWSWGFKTVRGRLLRAKLTIFRGGKRDLGVGIFVVLIEQIYTKFHRILCMAEHARNTMWRIQFMECNAIHRKRCMEK